MLRVNEVKRRGQSIPGTQLLGHEGAGYLKGTERTGWLEQMTCGLGAGER